MSIVRLVVLVSLVLVSAPAVATQGQAPGATDSVTVRPARDLALFGECDQAYLARDGSARAIEICRSAVAAANAAGDSAFAPRLARSRLGDIYMFAGRWSDAIAAYDSALSLKTSTDDATPLETGETLTKRAVAQLNLTDLPAADASATSAEAALEQPAKRDADEQQRYIATLDATLRVHAQIKRLRGDESGAQKLEARARALAKAK
jgi:tetratricopeptide (TPR) repeat protein